MKCVDVIFSPQINTHKSHAMVIKPDMEYENNQNSIDPDFPLIDAPKIPSPSRARLLAMLLRGYNDVEDYLTDTRTRERVSKRQRQCFWSVVTCF
ncbi:hypothetical protein KUTeg_002370 [Tegillarca granosa]|uniref:Uncharacterized protein n=1 Tax=Tegillarca granosa TaxID=220873 RepID=A0ABQ9FU50_TEGGR|nr:hypothetical protein KUTeg_002370 [Tegillarca granosa]